MPWQVRADLPPPLTQRRRGGRLFDAGQWTTLTDEEWNSPLGEAIRRDPLFSVVELNPDGVPAGAVDTQGALAAELRELRGEKERLESENQALTAQAERGRAELLALRTQNENLAAAKEALERREKPAEEPLSVAAARQREEAEPAPSASKRRGG